uniref:Uncharacterized protein n=1 Tax=Nothoprocta perdicaria TaxID=30464 RepID=A0A8C6YV20_NOTPE
MLCISACKHARWSQEQYLFLFKQHLSNQQRRSVVPSLTPLASARGRRLPPASGHVPFQCLVPYACVLTVLVLNKSEINVFDAEAACGVEWPPSREGKGRAGSAPAQGSSRRCPGT